MKSLFLFLLCLLTFLCTGVRAQTQIGDDLTGRSIQRWFGTAVDLSADGNTLVVGEPDFVLINDTSRVYIYQRSEDGWELEFEIFDPFGRSLGSAVAISADGRTVVMGAQANSNDEIPYAAVFHRSAAGQWSQRGQTLFATGSNTKLGCSVDVNETGDRIVIAQCGGTAFAQVYDLANGTWTERGGPLLESPFDDRSVAMSRDGDRVAVGFPSLSGGTGEVRVFEDENGNYAHVGNALPGLDLFDDFGADVDLSDDGQRLLIGVPGGNSGRGVVLLMEEVNGQWVRVGNTFAGPTGNNRMGSAVALSGNGNVVAFSSPQSNNNDGIVFVVERNNDVNTQIATLRGSDEERLAEALALDRDGSVLALGAPESGFNAGRVAVYELDVMTSVVAFAESDRVLSPNPTGGVVALSGDPGELQNISLSDLTGRVLLQAPDRSNAMDLSPLPAGVYLLTWREGKVSYRERVVKQ